MPQAPARVRRERDSDIMPDLLLELFSEEIPARMQGKAADDLKKLVTDALVEAGYVYEGARAFVTHDPLRGEMMLRPARERLDRSLTGRGYRPGPRVVAAELGPQAGIVGAADLVRQADNDGFPGSTPA